MFGDEKPAMLAQREMECEKFSGKALPIPARWTLNSSLKSFLVSPPNGFHVYLDLTLLSLTHLSPDAVSHMLRQAAMALQCTLRFARP